MTQTIEEILSLGQERADRHFSNLLACIDATLPEPLRHAIPTSIDDLGGLFSASTKQIYLSVFDKMPGFSTVSAMFDFKDGAWALGKFAVYIGGHPLFGGGKEFVMQTIEDAAVVSKKIADWEAKHEQKIAIDQVPDAPRVIM